MNFPTFAYFHAVGATVVAEDVAEDVAYLATRGAAARCVAPATKDKHSLFPSIPRYVNFWRDARRRHSIFYPQQAPSCSVQAQNSRAAARAAPFELSVALIFPSIALFWLIFSRTSWRHQHHRVLKAPRLARPRFPTELFCFSLCPSSGLRACGARVTSSQWTVLRTRYALGRSRVGPLHSLLTRTQPARSSKTSESGLPRPLGNSRGLAECSASQQNSRIPKREVSQAGSLPPRLPKALKLY